RVQVAQQCIVQFFGLEFRHPVAFVVDVSKYNCLSWANLLAGRLNCAVVDVAVAVASVDFGFADALHAVSAFLHYAAASNGNVGIALQLPGFRSPILIKQKIEPANFIWTVIGAVAGTYAAV